MSAAKAAEGLFGALGLVLAESAPVLDQRHQGRASKPAAQLIVRSMGQLCKLVLLHDSQLTQQLDIFPRVDPRATALHGHQQSNRFLRWFPIVLPMLGSQALLLVLDAASLQVCGVDVDFFGVKMPFQQAGFC